ncbi:ferritin-like domain-containing protein [Pseudoroseomonas wenyumeiae]|uniref:Ferritin-like domain-containing protein n=1 Tax=Teichococcus wenyumeiae TaxID=2478470 RepID=A0A3A9JJR7_9PROT|nr:ferritin-like domain-containing protein [Pseudoroseomonas wenyumeiae]RKK05471.1 ferritin-like domain-containing protein [Pseudoroseomonas wenyumeiae]RMI26407.1 ferritin-like domain-containing protein [Pseudoroseomonas wenyumeiae]
MKHWHIEQVAWDRFDPSKIDPGIIPLVKAAAMVEKNGVDYAKYLNGVFVDDPDFRQAADNWAVEEVQHGDALGKWAMLADPTWNFDESFERYRNGYKIDINADASIRGSRTGELIARCMVEIGTSSYYTALGEQTEEPVLKEVCKLIAADEYRHFKLFYDHMKRYLAREKLSFLQRLRVAAGRIGESEDDELAFAFHCGNDAVGVPYDHNRCIAGYMSRAMGYYRYHHIERGMGMMFKTIGLQPRGRLSGIAAKGAWRLLCWRRDKFQRETGVANENARRPQQAAA